MIFAGTPDAPCPPTCRVIDFDFRGNRKIGGPAEIGKFPQKVGAVYCYRTRPLDVRACYWNYIWKNRRERSHCCPDGISWRFRLCVGEFSDFHNGRIFNRRINCAGLGADVLRASFRLLVMSNYGFVYVD